MAAKFTRKEIEDLIRSYLPFQPTSGQDSLIEELVSFILRFRQDVGFVLKGYAGTGKTSVVSALVKALPHLNITPILLAPTGRAAKVLASYSGHPAYTIHKQIYYSEPAEDGRMVTSLRLNRSRNTLFIVDEASMLGEDDALLSDLFSYIGAGYRCRVLLVGDTAQLPPVGVDFSPALDLEYLTSSFPLDFFSFSLTEVVRQSHTSLVLENATRLRLKLTSGDDSLPLFELDASHGEAPCRDDLRRLSGEDLEDRLQTEYGRCDREGVVFITRSNKRANLFNQEIRSRVFGMEGELQAGELLMVLKNNYYWLSAFSNMGFIANGDMLEVLKIKREEEIYGFHFVDVEVRMVDYPEIPSLEVKLWKESLHVDAASLPYTQVQALFNAVMEDYMHLPTKAKRLQAVRESPYFNALQVKYAYALTCHKTQGGQWPCVFIDQGYFTEDMLGQEYLRWLYTALTRTTQRAYLLNFHDDFFL